MTKLRIVFDTSAKSTSGSLLNNQFSISPTVHALLIDVVICIRHHKVAVVTDMGKMY